jgi:hypothetical protein
MMRVTIGAGLVAIGAMAAVAVAGSGSVTPRDALLRSVGDRVRVAVGTCSASSEPAEDGSAFTECSDTAEPTKPPRPRLDVRPGESIRLRLPDNADAQDEPRRVVAALARVTDEGLDSVGGTVAVSEVRAPRRFELTLPDELRDANALDVFVRYRDRGDASYLAGLRRARSRG